MAGIVSVTGFKFPPALAGGEYRIDIAPASTWRLDPPRPVIGYVDSHEHIIHYNMNSGRNVTSAPVYVAVLENALVSPRGLVYTARGDLIYESLFPWQDANFLTQFGPEASQEADGSVTPKIGTPVHELDELFLAREGGEAGYFHFICSILPRIAMYKRVSSGQKIPLSVSTSKGFARDLLAALGISGDVPIGRWYRVKRLFFPSPQTREGDHFYRPPYGSHLIKELLRDVVPAGKPEKRIYLSRGDVDVRRITNEPELISILEKAGFETFTVGSMPILEQIKFFSTVKHLVSPHGAGLANMIFMPEGSSVLEILGTQRLWPTFRLLAARHGRGYHALIGETFVQEQTTTKGEGNEDVWVDPEKLRMAVQQMLL